MNYLMQYIRNQQVYFPTISIHPIDVMEHLLYTIGNGIDVIDGNLYDVNEDVPFKETYGKLTTFDELYDIAKEDGHIEDDIVKKSIDTIREHCLTLKLLGSYPKA